MYGQNISNMPQSIITQKRTPSPYGKQMYPTLVLSSTENNNTLDPIVDKIEKNTLSSARPEIIQESNS